MKELLVLWRRGLNYWFVFIGLDHFQSIFPILSCFINRYKCTYLYLNLYKFNLMAQLGYLCLLPQNSKDFRMSELVLILLKSNSLQINQILKYIEKNQNSTQQLKNKLQILRFYFNISRHIHTYRYIKCVLGNFDSFSGSKVYIY